MEKLTQELQERLGEEGLKLQEPMKEHTTFRVGGPADLFIMPKDADRTLVMQHVVSYSDIDMNGHTNNAMYMHWAMDAVDYEIASSRNVREMTINFNHETKAGECVSIYRAAIQKEDGLHVYVEGKVDGTSSFTVEIVF